MISIKMASSPKTSRRKIMLGFSRKSVIKISSPSSPFDKRIARSIADMPPHRVITNFIMSRFPIIFITR
jgi:hypothetical protein